MIPAIDLRHGEVVRLAQGDDGRRKTYGLDPREVLRGYAEAGVRLVHVVDLDAAFGEKPQRDLIAELAAGETAIELGGGLAGVMGVAWALEAGCRRVILGSIVARDFDAFLQIVRAFPGRVVPALEVAAGKLRISGWREEARPSPESVARRLRGLDCPAVLVTDVERDGTLEGPNLELARHMAADTGIPSLLSGGVQSLDDLRAASKVPEIAGAIVGKALYEGRFTVGEALVACRGGVR
ncbi:MAG: bifunctional 1-(5-phosphoribosyl)-5-((5-phosphoribosylamino)methylideneamino)imidazole-4-carboxamide isomerase/phosphoribosylanthranilate isomerase PriA [bacterium]|nr:bifunctional 1-(5-phosphoribosyl)-5-((5-phosphoribosylamino)methylideneamino)imidazole-4-carboxamide isomerase/phosphoribosylanthranilate isomerase PriA [bacterium]